MATLSKNQKSFLIDQNIPLSVLFDATGMGPKQYGPIMKDLGKKFAIGVSPCRKAEHTLRTRNGACMQCNTAAYTFLSRYDELGGIYIAGSRKGKIIKVGFSNDTSKREKTLNDNGYGGFNDWRILYSVECQDGGRVEFLIHKELEHYNTPRQYIRGNHTVDCLELFQCGYGTAIDGFERVLGRMGIVDVSSAWESPVAHEYHFPDILSAGATRKGYNKSDEEDRSHRHGSVLSNSVRHLRPSALKGSANEVDILPLESSGEHKVEHKKYPDFTAQPEPHDNVIKGNEVDILPLEPSGEHKVKYNKYPGFNTEHHPHENDRKGDDYLNFRTYIEKKPEASIGRISVDSSDISNTTRQKRSSNDLGNSPLLIGIILSTLIGVIIFLKASKYM